MSGTDDGKSKQELIAERQANLPLPDEPPVASDFNSNDQRTTAIGSGEVSDSFARGDSALREPATGDSAVRADPSVTGSNVQGTQGVGREGGAIPNDAVTRDKKDNTGLKETTGQDYGYPQKNDPADTSK